MDVPLEINKDSKKAVTVFLQSVFAHVIGSNARLRFGLLFGKQISTGNHRVDSRRLNLHSPIWFPVTFAGILNAAKIAVTKSLSGFEVYFTPALFRYSDWNTRRTNENAELFCCVFADIDFAELKEGTGRNYPTKAGAFECLERLSLPPSIIVLTGRGCHCYWLLKTPVAVKKIPDLIQRWQDFLRIKLGKEIDYTGEPARILRLPGTINHTTQTGQDSFSSPVYVYALDANRRYELGQFLSVAKSAGIDTVKGGVPKQADVSPFHEPHYGTYSLTTADKKIIRNLRINQKYGRLWRGDWKGSYPSQSEADLGLCAVLAFHTKRDPVTMDRIFRRSGLYRPKWDKKHGGDGKSYGMMTIAKACASNYSKSVSINRTKAKTGIEEFQDYGWRKHLTPLAFTLYLGLSELEKTKGVLSGQKLFSGVRELARLIHASPNSIRPALEELARHCLVVFVMGTPNKQERHATEIQRVFPVPKPIQIVTNKTSKAPLSLHSDSHGLHSHISNCHSRGTHITHVGGVGGSDESTPDNVIDIFNGEKAHRTLHEVNENWVEEVRFAYE